MSMVIEDIMESITIELCINKKRTVIVSCVYRTPGSTVDIEFTCRERDTVQTCDWELRNNYRYLPRFT